MGREKSKKGLCKHTTLIGLCSEAFVRAALPDQPEHRLAMTRNVILANIKRNRVSGLMSRETITDSAAWMREYAHKVSHHLQTERERWAKFCGNAANDELADLLAQFARKSSPNPLDVDEVLGQAYYLVKERIQHQFPFDEPVDAWLEKLTRAVAIQVAHEDRHLRKGDGPYEEMGFDDALANAPDDSYASQPDEWLESIDLRKKASRLNRRQRNILWRTLNGQTPDQIGLALNRSTKTVQNNLTEIGKQLGWGTHQ
jgi:DNA-directed RNA polymerase specialized sigma24 family protein